MDSLLALAGSRGMREEFYTKTVRVWWTGHYTYVYDSRGCQEEGDFFDAGSFITWEWNCHGLGGKLRPRVWRRCMYVGFM